MNPPGDERIQNGAPSFTPGATLVRAFDDFLSTTDRTIRSVEWEGGYCDPRFQVPLAAPGPSARTFTVAIHADRNDYPLDLVFTGKPLHEFSVSPADAHETPNFTVLDGTTCGARYPAPHAFYRYAATLPTPVSLTAGTKYWIRITAENLSGGFVWNWRFGQQHNNYSALIIGVTTESRNIYDLAWSLSS